MGSPSRRGLLPVGEGQEVGGGPGERFQLDQFSGEIREMRVEMVRRGSSRRGGSRRRLSGLGEM